MKAARQAFLVKTSLRRFTVYATSAKHAGDASNLKLMTGEVFDFMRDSRDISYDIHGERIDWSKRVVPQQSGRTWV